MHVNGGPYVGHLPAAQTSWLPACLKTSTISPLPSERTPQPDLITFPNVNLPELSYRQPVP